jgi:N-acetylmuramoyl-L-alanine amidase
MILLILSLSINISGNHYLLKEYRIRNKNYVLCDSLTKKLNLSSHWDNKKQIMTLQKEKIISLVPDNPFIKIENDIRQIEIPPLMISGRLFLPKSSLDLILSNLLSMKAYFKSGTLEIGTRVNIFKIEWEVESSITRYAIECSPSIKYFFNKNNGEWVLTLFNPIYDKAILNQNARGLIDELKIEEGNGFLKFRFKTVDDLPMDIIRRDKLINIEVRKFDKRNIRTIVVDAGHGGKDPGAIIGSTKEKDIVLKIAKRLASRLTEDGFNVIMTRVSDEFIPLKGRTRIADEARADFFVSIHCNAAPSKSSMHGAETYFLSSAKNDWTRTVEATENSAIRFESDGDSNIPELDYILNDLAQVQFLEESQQAAIYIQESIIQVCGLYNRGVKQANFYVLRLNYMPAVLVEVAFLTNANDRRKLGDENFLEKVVEAIVSGIEQYARAHS